MSKRDALTTLLEAELERSKHMSVRCLANKCKVGYSTMRRILQSEGQPAEDTIVSIVVNLLPVDQAAEFLKEHLPHYGRFFSRFATQTFGKDESDGALEKFTEAQFLAFLLVYSRGKMQRLELESFLGRRCKGEIDTLIQSGLFLLEGDAVCARSENILYHDADATLQQIKYLADNFNVGGLDQAGNAYALRFEGLNDKGVDRLHRAVFRFLTEIDEIMFDESNKGDHVLAVGLMETVVAEGRT